ncbi:putative TetR family transcriptional regulator [Nocardia brasiliensis NBRC 14402]|nr:TetR/AcrR family transcriptional regulator [Nocardia brasiliensis]GAJ80328.1 putative TetR family transcriptional regulator [Nocardia brasiliensis NBRC 14402]SUB40405.1 Bacterial regulatory proteins, tetR family [Nocardia brasiliensis]
MEAALGIIRRGLATLTIRAVADAAGVSIASVTYHFPSRDELVQAVCAEAMARDVAATGRVMDELRADRNLLTMSAEDFADWLVDLIYDPASWAVPMFGIYLEISRQPELAGVCRAWEQAIVDLLSGLLSDAGAPNPVQGARILAASLDGIRLPMLADAGEASRLLDAADLAYLLTFLLAR